jgi:hypothetical protein
VEQNRRLSNNQFSKIYVEQNRRFSKIYMEKNRRFSKIYVDLPVIASLRPVPDTDPLHLLSFQRQPALRVPWITRRTHIRVAYDALDLHYFKAILLLCQRD